METEPHEEEENDTGSAVLVAQVVVLCIIVLTYQLSSRNFLKRLSVIMPASTFMILLGVIGGFLINFMQDDEKGFFSFDPEFFFRFLLPPIILGAGYSVRKDHFFHNFGSILLFAFLGTTLSACFIGVMIYVSGRASDSVFSLDIINSFVLGSTLSAVDPISIIVVLKSLGVDEHLYVLIFGEAVLNDAVAIVINRVFVSIAEDEATISSLPLAIGEIIGISLGSIAIGLAVGFLGAYIHRKTRFYEFPHLEVGLFFVLAYMPYELAELSGLSGIMAILFAGIVADYYTSYSLSSAGETTVREVIELISFVAESFVFTSLGMTIALFKTHNFQIGLIAFSLLWCLIGRVISVFPLAALLNWKRKHKISLKYQIVMFLSGLRGPVAFALSMAVPLHRDVIVTTTLSIAIFTTIVFGGAAMPILQRLNLTGKPEVEVEKFVDANELFPTKYTVGGGGGGGGGGGKGASSSNGAENSKRDLLSAHSRRNSDNSSFAKVYSSHPASAEPTPPAALVRDPSDSVMHRSRMGEFGAHRERKKPVPTTMQVGVLSMSAIGARGMSKSVGARLGENLIDDEGSKVAVDVDQGTPPDSEPSTTQSPVQVYERNESDDWGRPNYDSSRHWFNRLHQRYLKDMFRANHNKLRHHGQLIADIQAAGLAEDARAEFDTVSPAEISGAAAAAPHFSTAQQLGVRKSVRATREHHTPHASTSSSKFKDSPSSGAGTGQDVELDAIHSASSDEQRTEIDSASETFSTPSNGEQQSQIPISP